MHGSAHELNFINAVPLTHDAKGNITTNSNAQTYAWDFDNRMASATVPAAAPGTVGTHTYTYDSLGRRISKTVVSVTTVYIYSGNRIIAEYTSGQPATNPLRKYVYGSYIDERFTLIDNTNAGSSPAGTEELFYYHTNNLYSVTALTDSSGLVAERYAYTPYGSTLILAPDGSTVRATSTINNSYLYTGRRLDKEFATSSENTLYYYRARYHSPTLGRFINRDPILYGGGINLYAYVGNRSLRFRDPFGHHRAREEELIGHLPIIANVTAREIRKHWSLYWNLHPAGSNMAQNCEDACSGMGLMSGGARMTGGEAVLLALIAPPVSRNQWGSKTETYETIWGYIPLVDTTETKITVYRYDVYAVSKITLEAWYCDCVCYDGRENLLSTINNYWQWRVKSVVNTGVRQRVWKEAWSQVFDGTVELDVEDAIEIIIEGAKKLL